MSEYDLAIYESPRAGEGSVFEVIETHGSSSGGTMLSHVGYSYDEALYELLLRYPGSALMGATGGGGQPGRWYFNYPRTATETIAEQTMQRLEAAKAAFDAANGLAPPHSTLNRNGLLAALVREIADLRMRVEALEKADPPATERGFGP